LKARCINNSGEKLSKLVVDGGYPTHTQFHLNIGEEYVIYGVNVWRSVINYMPLNAAGSLPIWSPAELFQLTDKRVPPNWYFTFLISDPLILNAVWGYQELVTAEHHDGLLGGKKEAIALFFERKKEIDRFHSM